MKKKRTRCDGIGLEARFDNSLFFFVETCEEDVLCEKKGGATYPSLRRVLEIHWKKYVGLLKWCHSQWREGFCWCCQCDFSLWIDQLFQNSFPLYPHTQERHCFIRDTKGHN